MSKDRLVIIDADMLAGWRRPAPSLAQLWDAVDGLRVAHDDVDVAVVADASLRWALEGDERDQIDDDVATARLAFAPAGCTGGYSGFLSAIFTRAKSLDYWPVVITDRSLPGARLGRVRREDGRWVFDLDGMVAPDRHSAPDWQRRKQRKSVSS